MPQQSQLYYQLVETIAKKHNLNPKLVYAVCLKESDLDTYAMRFEPGWRWWLNPLKWAKRVVTTEATERVGQQMSWGLMQVMGTVARERGFDSDFPRLCRPEVGVEFGCRHLVWLMGRFQTIPEVLSAYNTGRPNTKVGRAYAESVLSLMR